MKKKIELSTLEVTSFVTNNEVKEEAIQGGTGRGCPSAYTCVTECFECTGAYCTHPAICG